MVSRVLVVEDDPINRLIYGMVFSHFDADISYAFDGEAALKLCDQNKYELIISDMGLPGIMGYDVVREIRNATADKSLNKYTPVIAVTSESSPLVQIRAIQAGVDAYVHKPYNLTEFRNLLGKYIKLKENV